MKLYHGSNLEFCEIDLAKGLPAKDFGWGFYATSSLECAEKTARQRVVRLGGVPKVMVFEADDGVFDSLNVKKFAEPCREWALFVKANRKIDQPAEDHNRDNRYDVVVGPIANDKLSLLFRLYEKDLITVDEFAQRMKFKELYTQYSFHTERAVKLLRFKEVLNVS